jgi:hypothetical protein
MSSPTTSPLLPVSGNNLFYIPITSKGHKNYTFHSAKIAIQGVTECKGKNMLVDGYDNILQVMELPSEFRKFVIIVKSLSDATPHAGIPGKYRLYKFSVIRLINQVELDTITTGEFTLKSGETVTFYKGVKDGPVYDPQGGVIGSYSNGRKHGEFITPNQVTMYDKDEIVSITEYYPNSSDVFKKIEFGDGIIVKEEIFHAHHYTRKRKIAESSCSVAQDNTMNKCVKKHKEEDDSA